MKILLTSFATEQEAEAFIETIVGKHMFEVVGICAPTEKPYQYRKPDRFLVVPKVVAETL